LVQQLFAQFILLSNSQNHMLYNTFQSVRHP